jgi:FkbM family methyltransferase
MKTRRRESSTTGAVKLAIARALSSPVVGKVVGTLTRDHVPSNGVVIDTSKREFTPAIKAQILFRIYEGAEIRFIRKYLRGASHVVELGSSLGVTSAHILDVLAPNGSLTCVEANPFLLDTLRETVFAAQQKTGQKVTIVHGAVCSARDSEPVGVAALAVGHSSLGSRLDETRDPESPARTLAVPTVTLSSLVEGLSDYALVSDIEGTEAAFIAEEQDALRRAKRLVIELHPTRYRDHHVSTTDMTAWLVEDHGFRILEQRGPVLACAR